MAPTKQCTKCNKVVSIEHYGDNVKGERFKTCDDCRERGKAANANARERNKKKPEEVTETLNELSDEAILNVTNIHLFAIHILATIFTLALDVKVHFKNPETRGICIPTLF